MFCVCFGPAVDRLTRRGRNPRSGRAGVGDLDSGRIPYFIEGDIVVESAASLSLQPGVVVIQNPYCRFLIEGRLLAVGTQTDTIRFHASDASFGGEGLHFLNTDSSTQDSSRLEYCELTDGVGSLPPDNFLHGGGIYIKNSSRLRLSHCFIHHYRTLSIIGTAGINGSYQTNHGKIADFTGNLLNAQNAIFALFINPLTSNRFCAILNNDIITPGG